MRRRWWLIATVAGIVWSSASARLAANRELTFEDRVLAQERIERVSYAHTIGSIRSFEEAVPRALLEQRVRTYLKQSRALELIWHTPVTAAMLQAEADRITASTRMPDRLQEVRAALLQDEFVFQECFARAALVDRLAPVYPRNR